MQNINTTTDTTDNTTNEAAPSLADYLTMRGEELRELDAQVDARKREKRDRDEQHMLNRFAEIMGENITPGLRTALALSEPAYTDDSDEEHKDYYQKVEATFQHQQETWTFRYWNGSLSLINPDGFQMALEGELIDRNWNYDRSIVDALRAYPEWLEIQQRRQDEANEAAYLDVLRASETPTLAPTIEAIAEQEYGPAHLRHYTTPAGSDPRACLLHRGAYITVSFATYYGEDGTAQVGTVEAWDKRWLLLTDDKDRQQIIAWRHVMTIEPRRKGDLAATIKSALADNDDMTRDEIPF